MRDIDDIDRELLRQLQQDATSSYAQLGHAVGLSGPAVHERVRKLRRRGVIRRTTVDLDPVGVGVPVLAFVLVRATAWMGDGDTASALADIPEIVEAHIIAGSATILAKVRTATTEELQVVLRKAHAIPGVSGTETIVVLETFFERGLIP